MRNNNRLYTILFVCLIVAAAVLYFYCLKTIPGGIFPDGAANGLDANLILDGQHQPFFPRGNGREALFFYLMAGAIKLFGVSNWSILIPGILTALATLVGVYLLGSQLFNRKVGLAGLTIAIPSYWFFIISRSGFRAILVPLFLVYFIYFLFKAVEGKKTALYASLSGLAFGLGFYSYIAYRMVLAWLAFFILLLIVAKITDRKKYAKYGKIAWWFAIFAIISVLPLVVYFVQDPAAIIGRAGQVSILSPELNQGDLWGTFLTSVKENISAFFVKGDSNWRHNISGFPLVDRATGLLFLGGFLFFFVRSLSFLKNLFSKISFNSLEYFIVFITFILMLVPAIMSAEGTPHGLRLIGVFPFLVVMAGWFLVAFYSYLANFDSEAMAIVKKIVLTGFISYIILFNIIAYWTIAAKSADYYYAYRKDLTYVSNYLNKRNDKINTFLALEEYSLQTTEFLTSANNQPYQALGLDKMSSFEMAPGQQVVFTASTLNLVDQFVENQEDIALIKQVNNPLSSQHEELMRVYEKK